MTSVADTRLLLTLEFPPTEALGATVEHFFEKELKRQLFVPSIVLTEFIKYAGARIGEDAARTRLRILKEKGLRTMPLGEKDALLQEACFLQTETCPLLMP